jgi:hypothetical protein
MVHAASRHPRDLTDQQWNMIGRFLPELPRRQDGRGRPWRENRPVLNGILWILRTGAPSQLTREVVKRDDGTDRPVLSRSDSPSRFPHS